jgi:hypothetical protein
MFLMFWYLRCIGFILWTGLCRAYRKRPDDALPLHHMRWGVGADEQHPAARPPALAARREADWQRIDAVLQSLRDRSTGEDQAA